MELSRCQVTWKETSREGPSLGKKLKWGFVSSFSSCLPSWSMLECKCLGGFFSFVKRNQQICPNGGRRLPWPELQNSLKGKILQIIALFGGSIQSIMSSERICHGQVTAQHTGEYPEFSCSSDQSGSSGSMYGRQCEGIGLLWLTLHFQLRQSLPDPAVVEQLTVP